MKLTPNWNQFYAHSWEKGVSISTSCRCVNKINILWEAQVSSYLYWCIISTVYSNRTKKRSYNTQSCQTVSFVLSFVLRNAINFWFFCQQCFWVYIDYVQLSTTHVPIQVSSISSCGLTYSWIPKWIHQTMKKKPKNHCT